MLFERAYTQLKSEGFDYEVFNREEKKNHLNYFGKIYIGKDIVF